MDNPRLIGHWHHYLPQHQTSALDVYARIEAGIATVGLPDEIHTSRVIFKEAGIASAGREYLRVERRQVAFDICAAPFGTGYFFSWWCHRLPKQLTFLAFLGIFFGLAILGGITSAVLRNSCATIIITPAVVLTAAVLLGYAVHEGALGDEEYVMEIPVIGWLYERLFNPQSYFRQDTALMFQEAVRGAVKGAIDETLASQGLRALSDDAWKPTLTLGR